jgi:hypothetical protein
MKSVEYPEMRHEVLSSLSSLANFEYQKRVWIESPSPDYFDCFDQVVHTLYDDCMVLPVPVAPLGQVLVSGEEVAYLAELSNVLTPMIERLRDVSDLTYMSDPSWSAVVQAALNAHCAMIRAGG